MKATTHIVGGFVFAGTLCSFTDVNILENQQYIIACAVFSIFPDIDTTKSFIGKIFYPVAWVINRKLGHRTFTHSLLFLALIWITFFALFKFEVIPDKDLLKIAVFATIGHFVFDMITVSGVPLLYPFFPNACVIPGNVNFRFMSGEWKSEMIVLAVCSLLCVSMQPLFENGFWTAYNRTFGTIKHVDRENKNTEFYVMCEYSYILNAETYIGEAVVIDSKENELILFDSRNIFTLNSDNPQLKVNFTRPKISSIEKKFEELQFFSINFDSLQNLLSGKLASGLIQSNYNVRYIDNAITYYTNFIKFSNRFDFRIYAGIDSSKSTMHTNIARLEASIHQSHQRYKQELSKWQKHINSIATLEDSLKSNNLSYYVRNKLQQELISLRRRNIEEPIYTPPASQIAELEAQKRALNERNLLFSGHLTVLTFGYELSESGPSAMAKPNYLSDFLFTSAAANSLTDVDNPFFD